MTGLRKAITTHQVSWRDISLLAEKLSASEEGLSWVELAIFCLYFPPASFFP